MVENNFEIAGNVEEYLKKAYVAMVTATKAANQLPNDLEFYKTLQPELGDQIDNISKSVLDTANKLWSRSTHDAADPIVELDDIVDTVALKEEEDEKQANPEIQGNGNAGPGFRRVIDAVDGLLERIDIGIEEINGLRKPKESETTVSQSEAVVTTVSGPKKGEGKLDYKLIHAQNIPRPQLSFKDKIDNSANTPFVWKIRTKPNARVPLEYGLPGSELSGSPMQSHLESMGLSQPGSPTSSGAATPVRDAKLQKSIAEILSEDNLTSVLNPLKSLPHPYQYEITHLKHPNVLFSKAEPILPKEWNQTPFEFVNTADALAKMLDHIKSASEIAVDLEHHNYRSFQGFTCLIQISTRERDYVVDSIALRSDLHLLNTSFTNPKVIKVLHGAESDIQWLQRDFGVYIVNLFDTYHATKVLNFQHHSLASLLKKYCQFEADKRYQLADWRIRPLPQEMMDYARSDTHFLLYIFDRLRNELLERGSTISKQSNQPADQLMNNTLKYSSKTALRCYEKDTYDAESGTGSMGWATLLEKWKHPFRTEQMNVYRALHQWRDRIARDEDESLRYVLPNHMLFKLADRMPTDAPQVLASCQPTPPLVRIYAAELALMIENTKAECILRFQEMKKLAQEAADEEEMQLRKESTHMRFVENESDDDSKDDEQFGHVPTTDVLDDENLVKGFNDLIVPESKLFGGAFNSDDDEHMSSNSKAQKIRESLELTICVPKKVLTSEEPKGDSSVLDLPAEHEFVPASERNTQTKRGVEAVVISKKYGKYKPTGQSYAHEGLETSDQDNTKSGGFEPLDVSGIDTFDDESMLSSAKRQKSSKKKSKKNKKKNTDGVNALTHDDVQSFDYSQTQNQELIPERNHPRARSSRSKRGRGGPNARFDPYARPELAPGLGKNARKPNLGSKSGSKTITTKK
ncbi:exosome nuclease subunit [Mycoemilia scoparia]|uniref:Exosome nuclease subunit n=1 Tax=Mycoemilia scoparia TaxID=417184 RepID=A0A9W8A004_9FUNG|nr:exosome nuclease subunit [Mycoemilia scoparia]